MRKLSGITSFVFLSVFVLSSCGKKTHQPISTSETINATVDMNKTYVVSLNNLHHKQSIKITEQASHYSVSETENSNTSENFTYKYTPALNYVGSDQVTIVLPKHEGGHDCEHHNEHNCSGHHQHGEHHSLFRHHDKDNDDKDDAPSTTTYIIKINVLNTSEDTAK